MNILKRIQRRINIHNRIGNYLRSRYSSFTVTRPYIIKVDEHDELKGKVAVITGGSGAIGRACAFRLAAEGAKVYVCGSRPTSAQPVVDEIIASGMSAVAIQLNVLDALSIQKTFKIIAEDNNGHIDILVNSAGGSARGKASDVVNQAVEVFDEILNINLRGAMICAKEAAKYMITNRYGRIINITSVIGLQGKRDLVSMRLVKAEALLLLSLWLKKLGDMVLL